LHATGLSAANSQSGNGIHLYQVLGSTFNYVKVFSVGGSGLSIIDSQNSTFSNLLVSGTSGAAGVAIGNSQNFTLTTATLSNNQVGTRIDNSTSVRLHNVISTNNSIEAFSLSNSSQTLLSQSVATHSPLIINEGSHAGPPQ
jgi:hypothetical protein